MLNQNILLQSNAVDNKYHGKKNIERILGNEKILCGEL